MVEILKGTSLMPSKSGFLRDLIPYVSFDFY
jgi:hypothetical protein